MEPHRVTKEELESELRDQVGFLLSSASAYDGGETAEAKRLALHLRILLLDSLLDKLHIRSRMPFYETAHPYSPDNALPHYGLVVIRYADVLPVFDTKGEQRKFATWGEWSQQVVLSDGSGGTLTRRELVKTTADKRGAHVDINLPPIFAHLTNSSKAAYSQDQDLLVFSFGERDRAADQLLPEPVAPSLRQLAHEVLVSLASFRPDAFQRQDSVSALLAQRHPPFGLRGVFMSRDSALAQDGPLKLAVHRSLRTADGTQTLG